MSELSQQPLLAAATAFLLLFTAIAAIDGVYVHLWKLRLHTRPSSYAEHLWHTASAVLFVPVVAALFVAEARGAVLWLGLAALVAIHVVEIFDVRAERESRRELGGLSRSELSVHVAAVASRSVAVVLVLLSLPSEAWSLATAPTPRGSAPALVTAASMLVLWGSVAVALLHVGLAVRWCPSCLGLGRPASGAARP